jgi:tryptophan synthase alpha subunit
MTNSITFNTNGTIDIDANGEDTVSEWLNEVVLGAGEDYVVSYITVSGNNLNRTPNVESSLATNQQYFQTATLSGFDLRTGTYTFTIRSIVDPSIVESKTVTMTLETEV